MQSRFATVLLALALPLTAQDDMLAEVNRISREISSRVRTAESEGNLLTVVETLRELEEEHTDGMSRQVVGLFMMQAMAELGHYEEAMRYADRDMAATPATAQSALTRLAEHEPAEAVSAIAELAEDETFVLINEAHHVPQHRAFTLELLVALRKQGFTHFAAETLSDKDTDLVRRGYPTGATGAYIKEPLYGDLVRTAMRLGYRIVPYESVSADREQGQAQNLIERILEVDDDPRVIVHAGYAHINERGSIAGSRTMAGQLKEITGIDPLTIDQTVLTEHSSGRHEHHAYRDILETYAVERATIFRTADGTPWSLEPGVRDITLVHPATRIESGRPRWLRMNGLRKPMVLPTEALGKEERVVVEARFANEGDLAIPVDRLELVRGQSLPALFVPEAELVIEARNAADELIWSTRAGSPKND